MTPKGSSPKPRRWNLSLTYAPKIEAVRAGRCTQTIRVVGKAGPKQVGDLISFHGWAGRPYYSSWLWRTAYRPVMVADPILVFPDGIKFLETGNFLPWENLNWLAKDDGIVPPTGISLREVLIGKNGKIPPEGIKAQIIRWSPIKDGEE